MADLLQNSQDNLISLTETVPQFSEETSNLLSTLSEATSATFNSFDIGDIPPITDIQTEKQVREAFASQEILDKANTIDDIVLDKIIAGATPKEVEVLLGGALVEAIEDVARDVMERRSAKFLVDSGLATEERAAAVMAEEFSPEGLLSISKTDRNEEFVATLIRLRTARQKVIETFKEENIAENALDILMLGLVPGHTSATSAKVYGRGVERLGTSVKNFSENFWNLPFKERMGVLDQFIDDLENNAVVSQNVFTALRQIEELISVTDEDAAFLSVIEALDAVIVGIPLAALYRSFKSISGAGRAARFKDVTPGRALVLRERDRATRERPPIIEGEFEDITPSTSRGLSVLEEEELIDNALPPSASL